MKLRRVSWVRCTIVVLIAIAITSCGGGGSGSNGGLCISKSRNQCGLLQALGAKSVNNKIVQGTTCDFVDSPVVLVSVAPPNDFADICTGTLITPNVVLTAAHCLPRSPVGITVSINGTPVPVSRVITHPGFRIDEEANLIFNDVGLLILAGPSHGNTLPLVVSRTPAVGERFAIFGFGLDEESVQGIFRSGVMEATSLLATHILGEFTGELSNTCGGDSGSPAVQCFIDQDDNQVRGIVGTLSSGLDPRCGVGDVSFFTLINQPQVLQFILDNAPNAGLV